MKTRLKNLVLILFSTGLMAIGIVSCATPAVKKPDYPKPNTNQGSQTSSSTSTSTSQGTTTKPKSYAPMQTPAVNQLNDSIVVIDSVAIERKAP